MASLAKSEERKANSGFISAFILAGGRSSRMGSDKALLSFGDQTLLQRALKTASAVAADVRIVGSDRYQPFGNVIQDIYPGCGPLGGIHAALTATQTDLNLILSVDMPLMSAEFLEWLVRQAESTQHMVVVPHAAGGVQPLCATYRRAAAQAAEQALKAGDYKIDHLFSRLPTRIITEQEIIAAGFATKIFRNINTPEEYEQCRPA